MCHVNFAETGNPFRARFATTHLLEVIPELVHHAFRSVDDLIVADIDDHLHDLPKTRHESTRKRTSQLHLPRPGSHRQ